MQVPRSLFNIIFPLPSTSAVLVLKCFGASFAGLLARVAPSCSQCSLLLPNVVILFEDIINEELTRKKDAEEKPTARVQEEAFRRGLPVEGLFVQSTEVSVYVLLGFL